MATTRKPHAAVIGRMAERQPELLNPLVAFFVMGWRRVFTSDPMHGIDQAGETRLLPNYVGMLGLDECVHMLLGAPQERSGDNDSLSEWASRTAAE